MAAEITSSPTLDESARKVTSTPSVTAILLCCNSENFVADSLCSALDQDCPAMQLIVSDDASADGTVAVVQDLLAAYCGPHQVELRQRESNSGSKSAHLNSVFPLAAGDIIVSFDDDDISEPWRVRRILDTFVRNPQAYAVYSSFSVIDESGRPAGSGNTPHPPATMPAREWFARVDSYAAGTTLAIRREVAEKFGDLDPAINEDLVLPFRASLLGDVVYIDENLVKARRHGASLTRNFDDFASIERYRERFVRGIERAGKHSTSRLADIETAVRLLPEQATELLALEGAVRESIATAASTAGLVSTSLLTRLATLLRLWRTGAYPEERIRQTLLAFAPRLYLSYKRHSLRSRGQHA